VLCVVAHPDDVEYGASSAIAAWAAGCIEVAYLLLTRGEAGIDGSPPEQTAELRTREQIAGAIHSPGHRQGHDLDLGLPERAQARKVLTCGRPPDPSLPHGRRVNSY
jgi:GlcNAc-PI de-N-acetylase